MSASKSQLAWHIEWQRTVTEYTGKSLTFEKDIFPALQGLAKKYSPVLGKYLAGMWDSTLIYSLTWCRDYRTPRNPRLQEWRAPTWSWASVDGKISFSKKFEGQFPRTFATVVSATTIPKGNDVTGELSLALLVLKGKSLSGRLVGTMIHVSQRPSRSTRGVPHDINLALSFSMTPFQGNDFHRNDFRLEGGGLFFDYLFENPGPHHVADGSEVFLMKVDETSYKIEHRPDHRLQRWLIFRKIDEENLAYERIGILKMVLGEPDTQTMARLYEDSAKEMEVMIV